MSLTPTWQSDDGTVSLYLGDCLAILPTLESGSVDLTFFDPPYGVGVADWDVSFDCKAASVECRRIAREGGQLYATCSPHIVGQMLGLFGGGRLLSWCKPNLPLRKNLNDWEWSTEFIVRWTRGKPATFNKPRGEESRDYWRIPVENGFLNPDKLRHPARKPMALLTKIVESSSARNDTVLDAFMGSCPTGVACIRLGRRFIGIEIDPHYFWDICVPRCKKALAERDASLPFVEAVA